MWILAAFGSFLSLLQVFSIPLQGHSFLNAYALHWREGGLIYVCICKNQSKPTQTNNKSKKPLRITKITNKTNPWQDMWGGRGGEGEQCLKKQWKTNKTRFGRGPPPLGHWFYWFLKEKPIKPDLGGDPLPLGHWFYWFSLVFLSRAPPPPPPPPTCPVRDWFYWLFWVF